MNITQSGYVAIIGKPNVGKSTLLNKLLGEKISIISPKPQTTRYQILGIKTEENAQIIYIDTPGINIHEKYAMNRYLNRIANGSMLAADILIFMVDANRFQHEDELILEQIKAANKPTILAINKIDLLKDKVELLPFITKLKDKFDFTQIIPLSVLQDKNVSELEQEIIKLLPAGEQLFPEEQITDKSVRFLVTEIIREKLIQATEEEIPYATTVAIEQFEEKEKITEISAVIWVEREGQKVIV